MMAVTVEVWPSGDIGRRHEIATLAIGNVSQLADDSHYVAVEGFGDDLEFLLTQLKAGDIDVTVDHRRADGALTLVHKVLEAMHR